MEAEIASKRKQEDREDRDKWNYGGREAKKQEEEDLRLLKRLTLMSAMGYRLLKENDSSGSKS